MIVSDGVTLTRYFYSIEERSDDDLTRQLDQAAVVVDALLRRPLLPFQREALICLVSDIVAGLAMSPSIVFHKSFLVSAVNQGMFQVAAAEFHQFCYQNGVVNRRAWDKRRAEQYFFSRGKLLFD